MSENRFDTMLSGYGLGLRQPHYSQVLNHPQPVDFFEILSENFMEAHPGHWEYLTDLRALYPLILHGVALNIAGTDPLNEDYLVKLKKLAAHTGPACISDHLCWTGAHGIHAHDLLPVPYTMQALAHIADRIKQVQDILGCPLVLENPSSYTEFQASQMPEWEFMARLCEIADCGLLLDINNVYVSAFNHRYDPKKYIDAMPSNRVAYMHLAGHRHYGTHIIDTHDARVAEAVWELYAYANKKMGNKAVMIEWDDAVPELSVLLAELDKAKDMSSQLQKRIA